MCIVSTTLDDDGCIVQLAGPQQLVYGERDGSASARISALDAAFGNSGFDGRSSPNIVQEVWEKSVMLATLGGITCAMRGTIGEIEAKGRNVEAEQIIGDLLRRARERNLSTAVLAGAYTHLCVYQQRLHRT